jgi:hypothetical protein
VRIAALVCLHILTSAARSCWQDILQRLDKPSVSPTHRSSTTLSSVSAIVDLDDTSCAFWTRGAYHAKYGQRATCPQYLENANGSFLGDDWVVSMGNDARRFWKTLARDGRAPATWGKIDANAWSEYTEYMYARHPELHLCDSDWKLHFWSTLHYPDWHKNNLGPKREVHKRSESPHDGDGDKDTDVPPPKRARTGESSTTRCLRVRKLTVTCRLASSSECHGQVRPP